MIPRQQLLFGLPTAVGGVLAAMVLAVVAWPQWQQVEVARSRAAELRQLETRLPLLAAQLQRERLGSEKAQGQQALVLQLIAGSGTLATFMAQVDRLAARSGVRLSLYEPLAGAAPPPDPKAAGQPAKPAGKTARSPQGDPLLAPGVAKQEVLLSAAGHYPALVTFLRQLEGLSVLVVQSNLQLSVEEQKAAPAGAKGPQPPRAVLLKMAVATYSRSPE